MPVVLFAGDFLKLVEEGKAVMPCAPSEQYFTFLEAFMALTTRSPLLPWLVYNRKRTIKAEQERIERERETNVSAFIVGKGYIQLSEVLRIREEMRRVVLPPLTTNEAFPTAVRALIDFGKFIETQLGSPIRHTGHFGFIRSHAYKEEASWQSHSKVNVLTYEAGESCSRCQHSE